MRPGNVSASTARAHRILPAWPTCEAGRVSTRGRRSACPRAPAYGPAARRANCDAAGGDCEEDRCLARTARAGRCATRRRVSARHAAAVGWCCATTSASTPELSRDHCGATDFCRGATRARTCGAGWSCSRGRCSDSCDDGLVNCGGECIDAQTDQRRCGASGNCQGENAGEACRTGFACQEGACVRVVSDGPGGSGSSGGGDVPEATRVIASGGGGCTCSVPGAAQDPDDVRPARLACAGVRRARARMARPKAAAAAHQRVARARGGGLRARRQRLQGGHLLPRLPERGRHRRDRFGRRQLRQLGHRRPHGQGDGGPSNVDGGGAGGSGTGGGTGGNAGDGGVPTAAASTPRFATGSTTTATARPTKTSTLPRSRSTSRPMCCTAVAAARPARSSTRSTPASAADARSIVSQGENGCDVGYVDLDGPRTTAASTAAPRPPTTTPHAISSTTIATATSTTTWFRDRLGQLRLLRGHLRRLRERGRGRHLRRRRLRARQYEVRRRLQRPRRHRGQRLRASLQPLADRREECNLVDDDCDGTSTRTSTRPIR